MRKKWNSMNTLYLSVIVLGVPTIFLSNNVKELYDNLDSNKKEIFVNLFENKRVCLEDFLDNKCFEIKFREYNINTIL